MFHIIVQLHPPGGIHLSHVQDILKKHLPVCNLASHALF